MPEILPDHVPSPRTPLVWDGTRYRAIRGHTDGTVQVRGEDQLFSFKEVLSEQRDAVVSGVDGYVDSDPVPAGEIWVVTTVAASDPVTAPSMITMIQFHDGAGSIIHQEIKAFALDEWCTWSGLTTLDEGDVIRVYFKGAIATDTGYVQLSGYVMTLET